ncbi:Ammonium transporter 1 member 1 [Striga hermonthica]|uniref:Ammonium transporter 1 member 1 n=1 Tax=Striga hermonthica TaxID=68872 RepID=A0A9N7MST3_STRHE|nr:Ammonium transporter 1 member 1 [Striga hermonthica]
MVKSIRVRSKDYWDAHILVYGPRVGRFDAFGKPVAMRGHNVTLVVLCTFLLWFGWFGFNPGSFNKILVPYLGRAAGQCTTVGRTSVTTTLAGSMAGVTTMFDRRLLVATRKGSTCATTCWVGLLQLLRAARSSSLEPRSGGLAARGYGAWGLIFTGLFATEEFVVQVYDLGRDGPARPYGLLLGGGWGLIGAQVVELLVVVGSISITMGPLFYLLHWLEILRISRDDEVAGLDVSSHGGYAFNNAHHEEETGPRVYGAK